MKILVIGDACIDFYHYGNTRRKNPESSAPLLNDLSTVWQDGMAVNVANNLTALGAKVHSILPEKPWSEKHRYMDSRLKTTLLRVDYDKKYRPLRELPDLSLYDAVVVSDYGKGFVSHDILQKLNGELPVFVDTKKQDLGFLSHAWVKINEAESKNLKSKPANLVVTLAERGSVCDDLHVEVDPVNVVDPCGAGDTYLAAFAWSMVKSSHNLSHAMDFSNRAAAITCQHRGTYAPKLEDIYR